MLAPGGGVVLIEPYHGPAASLLYERLFASESFDKDMPGWQSDGHGQHAGGQPGALLHRVRARPRRSSSASSPGSSSSAASRWTTGCATCSPGASTSASSCRRRSAGLLKALERLLHPARRVLALHQLIVLRRRGVRRAREPGGYSTVGAGAGGEEYFTAP